MKLLNISTALFTLLIFSSQSFAQCGCGRPDEHAPMGVMGEHMHKAGEGMFSYQYMGMEMDGLLSGSSSISEQEVLSDYMVTPTEMQMQMHMFGMMYAPRDWITVMSMVPYVEIDMDHLARNGNRFTTQSSGLGDIKLSALIRGIEFENGKIILNAGVSLPSGEIDERDQTPAGADSKLPYPMQLGSGTVDLLPGVTYTGQSTNWSWGGQAKGSIPLGRNDNGYSLGERLETTAWGAYLINSWLSSSLRISWSIWGDIDGADSDLNANMVPTADAELRAGRRLDISAGVNLYVPKEELKDLRIAAELIVPVYQNLDGPQLETDLGVVLGMQYSF